MNSIIFQIFMVFILNLISNALGTLKTIFITKKILKPLYFITFIDAVIFSYGLKVAVSNKSFLLILFFALGKVVGVYVGEKIENKMAIGILEVTVYAKPDKGKVIADTLRDMGYSVTTYKGYGYKGAERFVIKITIERKEIELLKQILKKYGYSNANMIIKEVIQVNGKITTKSKNNVIEFNKQ